MKRSFIAFVFDADGYLKPYTSHPLFTGKIAPDCGHVPGAQGSGTVPTICDKLKVREWDSPGQCAAAISDYKNGYHLNQFEKAGFKPQAIEPVVLLERIVPNV